MHEDYGGCRLAKLFSDNPSHQMASKTLLRDKLLDEESLDMLESRWSIVDVHRWKRKDGTYLVRNMYQWYSYHFFSHPYYPTYHVHAHLQSDEVDPAETLCYHLGVRKPRHFLQIGFSNVKTSNSSS